MKKPLLPFVVDESITHKFLSFLPHFFFWELVVPKKEKISDFKAESFLKKLDKCFILIINFKKTLFKMFKDVMCGRCQIWNTSD